MSLSSKVIGLGVGIFVLAALLPTALGMFFDANTTGWDANAIVMWGLIPIAAILGVVLYLFGRGKG